MIIKNNVLVNVAFTGLKIVCFFLLCTFCVAVRLSIYVPLRAEADKLKSTTCFCMAYELRIIFYIFKWLKNQKG